MREIIKLAAPPRGKFLSGSTRVYCRPLDLMCSSPLDKYFSNSSNTQLAGGEYSFNEIEIILRDEHNLCAFKSSIDSARKWALAEGCLEKLDASIFKITSRRSGVISSERRGPLLMGVVNTSPDSFYANGSNSTSKLAISLAHSLIAEGVDIIDIGGESTRPGSNAISTSEELNRIIDVIRNVKGFGVPISVDTKKAAVMEAAISAGASIINDVTALTGDPRSLMVAAKLSVPVILMHMQGNPITMQKNPQYDNSLLDVFDYLQWRFSICLKAGLLPGNLIVDPGIGFGKNDDHNLSILRRLSLFHSLGAPILLGASRKSLIAGLSNGESANERLPGSLTIGLLAADQGVQILRVHDVAETKQALLVKRALNDGF